jgi:hypothetical protein
MLQPWNCDQCDAAGNLECLSSDDSLTGWDAIALLHAAVSPAYHAQYKSSGIRVGNWHRKQ